VIRPSKYPSATFGFDGELAFLRLLREQVIMNIRYGASQHRTRVNRFNFLIDMRDANIPQSEPLFACPSPIVGDEDAYNISYPWVNAVGAQLNPDVYEPNHAPTTACASANALANGGGTFFYHGYAVGVFEHEFSHALYVVPDEYEGGSYLEDAFPGPFPSQYASLGECQADASAEGWNENDCHLACDASKFQSCGRNWYSAELRPPTSFSKIEDCEQWRIDHGVSEYTCEPLSNVFSIPGLRDLMVDADVSIASPASRLVATPAPSFQRACERRVLYYLDDPQLMQFASATAATSLAALSSPTAEDSKPFVSIRAEISGTNFVSPKATVVMGASGPRFDKVGRLHIIGLDSHGKKIAATQRHDVRFASVSGIVTRKPNGTPVWFAVDLVPGLRRVKVIYSLDNGASLANGMNDRGRLVNAQTLLELDLLPTITEACKLGRLPRTLCSTPVEK
jgi:hypothetical protein